MDIDKIGEKNSPVFIIAELSANHNQDIELARKTIKAMAESGADAVKLQTYTPDTITLDCRNDYFKITQGTIWDGQYLHDLYQTACTPWDWHAELKEYAESLGLIFFSTPFDFTAVELLENLDVQIYKIASFEINDIPLIKLVASKGKPMIISTGIAEMEDIELALKTCRDAGNDNIILLKCTSSYPAPAEEANLNTISDMAERFGVRVGLSDHTMGTAVSVAAVALGAKVIEKHFILDRGLGGADSKFSMEPAEFKKLVDDIRVVEKAVGKVSYELTEKTKNSREHSRSLFVVKDINAGEVFTTDNVRSIRPGFGMHTKYYEDIIGKCAAVNIEKGTPLSWELIK